MLKSLAIIIVLKMIEELNKLYHQYDKQIEVYKRHKAKLSKDEKYNLINEFFEKRDFWGYFELITDIMFEISDSSDKFAQLLEKMNNKVKNDMAQKPFMDLFIKIGEEKPFALDLYDKILNSKLEESLRIVSGLILGGYSLKYGEKELSKRIAQKIEYPYTNSYLKAILVKYDSVKIPIKISSYLEKISKAKNEKILFEFCFICMKFYKKEPKKFYNYIRQLVKLNNNSINWIIFDRFTYQDIIPKNKRFELIEMAKDYDVRVINKIVESLRKYPDDYKQITKWLIYWLNKHTEFKIRHFDWILEELVKQNKLFIREFFEHYKEIEPEKKLYLVTFPHIFTTLSKYHQEYALKQIFRLKLKSSEDKHIFFKLCNVLIGNIYTNISKKDICLKLNNALINIAKRKGFISFNEGPYRKKISKSDFTKEDYDFIIDFADNLLSQLQNRKEKYDFRLIEINIKKYPEVYAHSIDALKELEHKKKFSSLMWLGETEEPKLEDIEVSDKDTELNRAMKISYLRGRFWPRAYLKELNSAFKTYNRWGNEKYSDKNKQIKKDLMDDAKFWSFESELVFTNKFSNIQMVLEPKVPNRIDNHLDLKINLFGKNIYFEIKRSETDRNLRLNNGAVGMSNKAFQTIDKKFRQLFTPKTLKEMKEGIRKDLFFIVIDIGSSIIDEYQIMNAFFGSLSLTLVMDKQTGKSVAQYPSRLRDAIHDKNMNTDVISGVIYFKQELMFNEKSEPYIKLKGGILQNPKAINKLSEIELNKLEHMIFN